MSDEKPSTWPLLPSHSAYVLHGLCLALTDLIQEEGGTPSRRTVLKTGSITLAAELVAGELAHFFGSRMGDHEQLEAIQERYIEERSE